MCYGVLYDIDDERERQEALWGEEHDDDNTMPEWISTVVHYLGKGQTRTAWVPREDLIKAAAVIVAAIEAGDRKQVWDMVNE